MPLFQVSKAKRPELVEHAKPVTKEPAPSTHATKKHRVINIEGPIFIGADSEYFTMADIHQPDDQDFLQLQARGMLKKLGAAAEALTRQPRFPYPY